MPAVAGTPQDEVRTIHRILLVEDDEELRDLLRLALERRLPGLQVLAVGDGRDGLAALDRDAVDVVLCDYHLPDMTGLEFLRRTRQAHPGTRRVMLTGLPDPDLARSAQVDRFFLKPLDMDAFTRVVKGLLARPGGM